MAKIPVGATIAHAYRFAFSRFPEICGVMWVAWLLQSAGSFFFMRSRTDFIAAVAHRDMSALHGQWGTIFLFYLVSTILTFMQFTAVTGLALGLRKGPPYYYFSLGKALWRLIGAFLLALLAILAVAIAYIVVMLVLGLVLRAGLNAAGAPNLAKVLTALGALLAILAAYGGGIYVVVRFIFLLAPATIAEERVNLGRAWTLARGNFWRSFAIILAILLPFIAVELIALFGFSGMPWPHGGTPDNLRAFEQARSVWQVSLMTKMTQYWYLTYPVAGLFTALMFGMSSSAQAFAYRALTGPPATNPS